MKDLISIIVPVYNVEKYLDKCINSIINQTYKNLEIILINDGSKDNSGEKCECWAQKDNRIKVIHKKNGGLSDARNVGIDNAKGRYISFIDSDDFIDYNMIEILIDNIKKNNCEISVCGYYKTYTDRDEVVDNSKDIIVMDNIEAIDKMNEVGYFDVSAWGKVFKADLIKKYKFPIGKLSEDWFIMYKVFFEANKIVYNPEAKYHYVQRSGGISKNNPKINYDSIEAAKECLNFIEKKCPNIKENAIIRYCIANIGVYNSCILYDKEDNSIYNNINKNIKIITKSKKISFKKKLQFFILINFKNVYKIVYKNYFKKVRYKEMIK
ncbi:glycosyltransferase [Clostridium baratii]|uniref:glycosyltransferase family 2 protein n=1 Tax=Clostridium baratii TaxID=1561 RepID=UPI0030D4571A